ncbi:MAG TPA: hypothetical protein VE570_09650 [Thermoleophilaceae bacterium]|jgi:hypothetical protein|nr:hypothetical protein [Thermoleophilaceae bacterium]
MNKLSAALALILVCAGPAVAAKPPKGGGPNPNLTINASATLVTFGRTVTLSGTTKGMSAGTAVEVQRNPYPYAGFTPTGKTGVVDPAGNWSIAGVAPQVHTQYRVVAKASPPVESGTVFVRVRMRVGFRVGDSTPARGTRVRFFGTVASAHDGKLVLIQRKTATGFRTVARTTLLDNGADTSKYSRRVRIRSTGTYRVVVQSADQDHDDGISRSRTLRVH